MFNNNDNGGWNPAAAAMMGNYATQADLQRAFDTNTITSKLDGITNGLSDGFYAMNTSNLQGFNGIQRDLCQGFNGINNNIAESRFAAQSCCCETNRNIDAVRFENSRNTCDITTAIHAEGEATRALINANTVQELRDRLEQRDRDILARDFQLSQLSQNQTLVRELKPQPVPSYLTCSPYTSVPVQYIVAGQNTNGCGCQNALNFG